MKNYLIYLKAEPECDSKAPLKEIEEARQKAFEASKKIFKKEVKEIDAIKISKSQIEDAAIRISIDEEELDDTIDKLVAIDVVAIIDSHCFDVPKEDKGEPSAKDKMAKYLK